MKKQDDIFSLYNEMDNLLESINLDKKQNKKEPKEEIKKEKLNKIPEMPMAYLNHDEKVIIYDSKSKSKDLEDKKNIIESKTDNKEKETKEIISESKSIKKEIINKSKDNEEKVQEINEKKNKTSNNNKKRKAKKSKKWVIIFSILDFLALVCLFLMYGPISYFRNLWVTSAMSTMTHQYLAYIFFNQEQIDKIMNNNIVIEVEEDTNKEEIDFNQEEKIQYSSIYEEQVLKKDKGNDLYKVIDIEGNNYKGHLLVVYDASKVQLAEITNYKYGQTIEQFVEKNNAVAGINAGGFSYSDYRGYNPTGTVIIDGKIKFDNGPTGWGGGIVGFTKDNVLVLTKASANKAIQMGIRDAVSFGPFLIVNGVASQFKGNGGYGIAPRTAIGQRKDGIVLLLVIDGRRPGHSLGVDMVELTNIMLRYGAYNASNLDGGGSSSIVVEGETLSVAGGSGYTGERYLPNSWLVIP